MATSTLQASVAQLAERGKRARPELAARMDRAAEIVLGNGYSYEWAADGDTLLVAKHGEDGEAAAVYHVNGTCDCQDATSGRAPVVNGTRYCKHKIARGMLLVIGAGEPEPTPRPAADGVWLQSMAWVAFARSYSGGAR